MEQIAPEKNPLLQITPKATGEVGGRGCSLVPAGITYYNIAEASHSCNQLYSTSYASCIGIAIHREGENKGLLAHFWNYSHNPLENFVEALRLLIAEKWIDVRKGTDQFTIWTGVTPQDITFNRLKAFCEHWDREKKLTFSENVFEFKSISIKKANISGTAYLNLESGKITQDSTLAKILEEKTKAEIELLKKPISYLSYGTGKLLSEKPGTDYTEVHSLPYKQ